MKTQSIRSRFYAGSWYAGAGGLINIFSIKPYKPYKKIKFLYLEELKSLSKSEGEILTAEEKSLIRKKIEIQIKRDNSRKVVVFFIGVSVFSVLVLLFLNLITFLFK